MMDTALEEAVGTLRVEDVSLDEEVIEGAGLGDARWAGRGCPGGVRSGQRSRPLPDAGIDDGRGGSDLLVPSALPFDEHPRRWYGR